jgi:hypothetical protein
MPATTPFITKGRLQPENFFGRTHTIRAVVHVLRAGKSAVIQGAPRAGLSSLVYVLFKNYHHAERDARVWFIDLKTIATPQNLIEEFFAGLKIKPTEATLIELERTLRRLNQRAIFFIDHADKFADAPFKDEALFAVLATHLQREQISICLAMTLKPEKIFKNRVATPLHELLTRIELPPFTPAECYEFIQQRLRFTGVYFDDEEIERLIAQTGGMPADFQRAAAELFKRKLEKQTGTMRGTGSDTAKRK